MPPTPEPSLSSDAGSYGEDKEDPQDPFPEEDEDEDEDADTLSTHSDETGGSGASSDHPPAAGGPPASQQPGEIAIELVPSEKRQSSDCMTSAEMAMAIAIRAKDFSNNGVQNCFLTPAEQEGIVTVEDLARVELLLRKSPLSIKRVVQMTPTKKVIELWSTREMVFPDTTLGF